MSGMIKWRGKFNLITPKRAVHICKYRTIILYTSERTDLQNIVLSTLKLRFHSLVDTK